MFGRSVLVVVCVSHCCCCVCCSHLKDEKHPGKIADKWLEYVLSFIDRGSFWFVRVVFVVVFLCVLIFVVYFVRPAFWCSHSRTQTRIRPGPRVTDRCSARRAHTPHTPAHAHALTQASLRWHWSGRGRARCVGGRTFTAQTKKLQAVTLKWQTMKLNTTHVCVCVAIVCAFDSQLHLTLIYLVYPFPWLIRSSKKHSPLSFFGIRMRIQRFGMERARAKG